jgi:hypothetical protein
MENSCDRNSVERVEYSPWCESGEFVAARASDACEYTLHMAAASRV